MWAAGGEAADKGQLEVLRALLAEPVIDVNKANYSGWTAVMIAAASGKTEIVKALLTVPGIDVNKTADDGYTAIIAAAEKGHSEVVRALLSAPGIDVNKVEEQRGYTSIMHAASEGHTEVARALLAAPGIDLNRRSPQQRGFFKTDGKTALDIAIDRDNREIAALLRSVKSPEGAGQRIYDAARRGDVAALGPLLQEWSGIEDVLNWSERETWLTPLIVGCREGKTEAVRLLIAIATSGESRLLHLNHYPPTLSP